MKDKINKKTRKLRTPFIDCFLSFFSLCDKQIRAEFLKVFAAVDIALFVSSFLSHNKHFEACF
jgi:hypothetical protein